MAYYNPNYTQPTPNAYGSTNLNTSGFQPYNSVPPTIVFVSGEAGANNYPVAAGNTVYLMDLNSNQFWIKSTAANGTPQPLRSFSFTETTPKVEAVSSESYFVTKKELDDLKSYLDNQFQGIRNQLYKAKKGPLNDKSDVK